jgi:alpha-ribazole phosphatase
MTAIVTRWWLIRHAPVVGAAGRIYGQDDLDCDCSDTQLFAALALGLPANPVWLATHLRRSQATATALFQAISKTDTAAFSPEIEPGLAEQHFGAWQGRTYEELVLQEPDAYQRFWQAPANQAPPEGESFRDLIARVAAAIQRRSACHAGHDIVAISHGGAIRAALAAILDLEPMRALSFSVDPCSVTRFDHIQDREGGTSWRVLGVNHLPGDTR